MYKLKPPLLFSLQFHHQYALPVLIVNLSQAHINVEVCASIKSVKYLFKYIYKGHDIANVTISGVAANALDPEAHDGTTRAGGPPAAAATDATAIDPAEALQQRQAAQPFIDETKEYLTGRYIGASEACWRLYAFVLHGRGASVVRLPVHLDGQLPVEFDEEADLEGVLQRGSPKTMLTAWFDLNRRDETARDILYMDIPSHYVWMTKTSGRGVNRINGPHWKRRTNQLTYPTVGRMYCVVRSQV